ncbi:MAG: DsbA family protein [Candidatus Absconditabacterales bacterium]|nr:DsbA family protein [Candidatus Absconditabacterales bacterium]
MAKKTSVSRTESMIDDGYTLKQSSTSTSSTTSSFFDVVWDEMQKKPVYAFLTGLILVTFAINAGLTMYLTGAGAVREVIEDIEAMKVGGAENFELFKKIAQHPNQAQQYRQGLEQMLAQLNGQPAPTPSNPQAQAPAPAEGGTLTEAQLADLKANGYIRGDKNAEILIIEYSGIGCPFCRRHHQAGTIEQAKNLYPGKVASMYNHFTLPSQPISQEMAQFAECVGEANGGDAFYAFVDKAYSDEALSRDALVSVVNALGYNQKAIEECVNSGKFSSKIQGHMTVASSTFGVNGTPGNVVINTKTRKWRAVSGAVPVSMFQTAIDALLQ